MWHQFINMLLSGTISVLLEDLGRRILSWIFFLAREYSGIGVVRNNLAMLMNFMLSDLSGARGIALKFVMCQTIGVGEVNCFPVARDYI